MARSTGNNRDNNLYGTMQGDFINGKGGNDYIDGKGGDDELEGDDGDDTILGGDGNDTISGDDGNDKISGDGGDDIIFGGSSSESEYPGDELFGGTGNDVIYGGSGVEEIYGNEGLDTIYPGTGNDTIYNDHELTPEQDIFIFEKPTEGNFGQDNLWGYTHDDLIIFSGYDETDYTLDKYGLQAVQISFTDGSTLDIFDDNQSYPYELFLVPGKDFIFI
jgi:Ca2+-binding RTX toxin-like protein